MLAVMVTMILDVDDSAEAVDAVNETLREHQRSFAPTSCILDYAINLPVVLVAAPFGEYEEGEAFA